MCHHLQLFPYYLKPEARVQSDSERRDIFNARKQSQRKCRRPLKVTKWDGYVTCLPSKIMCATKPKRHTWNARPKWQSQNPCIDPKVAAHAFRKFCARQASERHRMAPIDLPKHTSILHFSFKNINLIHMLLHIPFRLVLYVQSQLLPLPRTNSISMKSVGTVIIKISKK